MGFGLGISSAKQRQALLPKSKLRLNSQSCCQLLCRLSLWLQQLCAINTSACGRLNLRLRTRVTCVCCSCMVQDVASSWLSAPASAGAVHVPDAFSISCCLSSSAVNSFSNNFCPHSWLRLHDQSEWQPFKAHLETGAGGRTSSKRRHPFASGVPVCVSVCAQQLALPAFLHTT